MIFPWSLNGHTDNVKPSMAAVLIGFPKLEALSLNMQHLSVQSFLFFYPPVSLFCPSAQVILG